jgi:GT2 family glycosyltransferase
METQQDDYGAWASAYGQLTDYDRAAVAAHIDRLATRPSFLLVPLLRADDDVLVWQSVIAAARQQLYPHWQLALPPGWPTPDPAFDFRWYRVDQPSPEPAGHRQAFFDAVRHLPEQPADFILPLPPGAILDERALYEFAVASLAAPEAEVLYADQDCVAAPAGAPHSPRFKTGFDPELMLGRDALGLPVAYQWRLSQRLAEGLAATPFVTTALHGLALCAWRASSANSFRHVPTVLCHCVHSAGSLPDWDPEAAQAIVTRHVHASEGPRAVIGPAPLAPSWCRVKRSLPAEPPLVSIIIPTRDAADLLRNCVGSILELTDYPTIEILIVDNGSTDSTALAWLSHFERDDRVRVLRRPGPFNYPALNNAAAREAAGDVLLLLNNDTVVMAPGWLREMVSHVVRPDVGAVGAKLYYADGRVQHAGVVMGCGDMVSHQLRLSQPGDPGPQGELALTRTVLAVTGACLAVRRSVFLAVGGLDETLTVAFNDIDFCLRLNDHGYRVVWTPFAELYHLESASRGAENSPEKRDRMLRELDVIRGRWSADMGSDPFHNPNIMFGWESTGFASPPRHAKSWI